MSRSFSANQYENAFYSHRIQSWEVPKRYQERPRYRTGHTEFIACDRGHLLDTVPRSRRNPWADFIGTWDYPLNIPGNNNRVPTARAPHALELLKKKSQEGRWVLAGGRKNCKRQNLDQAYCSKRPPVEPTADPAPRPNTTERNQVGPTESNLFPDIIASKPRTPERKYMFTPPGDNRMPTPCLHSPPVHTTKPLSPYCCVPAVARETSPQSGVFAL